MKNEILPIGTVVLLKGGIYKIMICGYSSQPEDMDTVYDYVGCVFPIGFMDNLFCLFNKDEIDEICYVGLENEEFNEYKEKITQSNFESNSLPPSSKIITTSIRDEGISNTTTHDLHNPETTSIYTINDSSSDRITNE